MPGTARWARACPRSWVPSKARFESPGAPAPAPGARISTAHPAGRRALTPRPWGSPLRQSGLPGPHTWSLPASSPVQSCLGALASHRAVTYSPDLISSPCALRLPLYTHLPPPSLWASSPLWAFICLSPPFSPGLVAQDLGVSGFPSAHSLLEMLLLHLFAFSRRELHPLSLGPPPPKGQLSPSHLKQLSPTASHACTSPCYPLLLPITFLGGPSFHMEEAGLVAGSL